MLPTPGFHHLHLNSPDPDAAIARYIRLFPSSQKGTWAGFPALLAPNSCMLLFTKVDRPAPESPQSAIWHFGWHVSDARARLARWQADGDVDLQPLYTGDGNDDAVFISSDTWFRNGTALGLTREQRASARAANTPIPGGPGFVYLRGPDNALVEYAGDYPAERFNHIHMWQEDPMAALAWYQRHLSAEIRPGTEATPSVPRGPDRTFPALNREGMFRFPRAGVTFGDVDLAWYANQWETPLASPLGQLQDHIALSVTDLDAWTARLRGEGVTILSGPYRLGDARAIMIEGPSREAIELLQA